MSLQHVLVVGGAGYIGSHMVLALQEAGFTPIVLDNLSKGHASAVLGAELVTGDMNNKALLDQLFTRYDFAAVMHFASFIEVGESVLDPLKYYQNNVSSTLTLLERMLAHNVKNFIFSSTAAVYGEPQYTPIDEAHPLAPINPYGRSKAMIEDVCKDLIKSHGLRLASLRYFNAAGSDPESRVGECHEPESHLIPLLLQVAAGKRKNITVYGRDYATPDSTCVRDYVHVSDLCSAHLLALQKLIEGESSIICNLGTGHGYSVQAVIDATRRVTGHAIPVVEGVRRTGDPAVLVADATRAQKVLNWQPKYATLDIIIDHAWQFMRNHVIA